MLSFFGKSSKGETPADKHADVPKKQVSDRVRSDVRLAGDSVGHAAPVAPSYLLKQPTAKPHTEVATQQSYQVPAPLESPRADQFRAPEAPENVRLSKRMAEHAAFKAASDDIEKQLRQLANSVALSTRAWSLLQGFVSRVESDIIKGEETEAERNDLATRLPGMERDLERRTKELEAAQVAARGAEARVEELRAEVAAANHRVFDSESRVERLRIELEGARSDLGYLRSDLNGALAQAEKQTAAREGAEQLSLDLEEKLAKLSHAEAYARNRVTELELQVEKLRNQLPALIAEQENLQQELRGANRERGDLKNELLSAQDRIAHLEGEAQSLQGQLASAAFSSKTEVESGQAALRAAERTFSDYEKRIEELQSKLQDADHWKRAAERQFTAIDAEVEAARREAVAAGNKLSELNLKYQTDLVLLEQHREQNIELRQRLDALQSENRRIAKFESLYKSSESQNASLRSKLNHLIDPKHEAREAGKRELLDIPPPVVDHRKDPAPDHHADAHLAASMDEALALAAIEEAAAEMGDVVHAKTPGGTVVEIARKAVNH